MLEVEARLLWRCVTFTFFALASSACVTADPTQMPGESVSVKSLKTTEATCRDWVKATLGKDNRFREADYYYGKLPRESAKAYVVFLSRGSAKTFVALCDSTTGTGGNLVEITADGAKAFKREFDRRERSLLAPRRQDFRPNEMADSSVVVMHTSRSGKVLSRDYWLPKNVAHDFNDLFFETVRID